MYFSGRITNSFFVFLKNFIDLDESQLFGMTDLEIDFIKDPNSWMYAQYVEVFLRNIRNSQRHRFTDKDLAATVGHSFHELNSWGGLDKFLKTFFKSSRGIFKSSRDIYKKLDVIFEHFLLDFRISESREDETLLSFKTNFQSEKYPVAADYLKAVLEKFPAVFFGEDMTEANWEGQNLNIYYPAEKTLPLPLKELEPPASPSLNKIILLKKISAGEQKLLDLKKAGEKTPSSADPANEALKILSEIKSLLKEI